MTGTDSVSRHSRLCEGSFPNNCSCAEQVIGAKEELRSKRRQGAGAVCACREKHCDS